MTRPHLWLILAASIAILLLCTIWSASKLDKAGIPPVYGMGMPGPGNWQPPAEPGNFYLIAADRLTMRDITEHAGIFDSITGGGALGLISTGVEGGMVPDSTFASIGAGAPLNAYGTAYRGLNRGELFNGMPAGESFRQRTGLQPETGAVLQLDIARIKKLNAANRNNAIPGHLGALLQNNGYNIRVYGNSDTYNSPKRAAVGLAMNQNGSVGEGDVGAGTQLRDEQFPGQIRTDYEALLEALGKQTDKGLTVVELGDLERLERMGKFLEDDIIQTKRRETINRMVGFIASLVHMIDMERDRVIIVSPTPRGNNVPSANYVTPVIALGAGVGPGLLTSPTTKRPGVIKNTDLAPTILGFYGIDTPARMSGRGLMLIPAKDALAGVGALYNKLEMNFQARPPVLRHYVLIQLALVIISLAAIFIRGRNTLMQALKPALLAVMSVPLALLLVPLLPHFSIPVLVAQLVAVTVGITTLIHLWLRNYENELDPFIFISLLTSLCIAVDLLMGAPLQKSSLLGYDPVVGARFYGLGNEYMGILLGSTIIGTTALITRIPTGRRLVLPAVGVYYLAILYVIAAPQLGTNVGGSIAGAGSFLVTMLLLAGVGFNWRTLLKTAATVGVFLAGLVFYDLQRPVESQSHIGRTAELIIRDGPLAMKDIIQRKLNMNIKLLKYTIWSRVFLASLFTLAILFYRPVGVIQSLNSRYPELYRGFIGVVTASLLALVFNDSGVVAAATAMIFGAPPLLYLVIRTRSATQTSS